MNMGASIRTIAEAVIINSTTAFFLRHKIFTGLKDGTSDAALEQHMHGRGSCSSTRGLNQGLVLP